jgi:hypothetical protein
MAKKKESIDLLKRNLEFEIQHVKYKAVRFDQEHMSIEIVCLDKSIQGLTSISFSQLPKEIKKLVKPN